MCEKVVFCHGEKPLNPLRQKPQNYITLTDEGDLKNMQKLIDMLEDKGYTFLSADIAMVPQNYISLTDEGDLKNMQKLIDMLEDNDDVQNVWHNWENE